MTGPPGRWMESPEGPAASANANDVDSLNPTSKYAACPPQFS